MAPYSLQSSLAERARRQAPALDIAAPRKTVSVARVAPSFAHISPRAPVFSVGSFDGIKREQSALPALQPKRGWFERLREHEQWSAARDFFFRVGGVFDQLLPRLAPHKMLYGSIAAGIAFGMVSMAFIEHSFGPGVFARSESPAEAAPAPAPQEGVTPTSVGVSYDPDQDIFFEYFSEVTKEKYEQSITGMVKGYPIEAMLPYIFSQDRLTAAFLIGIAKKESNWGRRVPVLDDQDCFNYWGYRGVRRMMGTGGHTCFNGRKDAVETVATRLKTLVNSEKLNTPEKMIVWKCGYSCQGHSRESVKKWISDVDMYFSQLSDK